MTQYIVAVEITLNWMEEILCYKKDGTLPVDQAASCRLRYSQALYYEINGQLYRRSFSQTLLRFLTPPEVEMVLAEVYEGLYEECIDGRTLAFKILGRGYYWLTMHWDTIAYVQRCQ